MFDTHVHTKVSSDSKMNIEDAIYQAKNNGFSLIITEHLDLKFPKEGLFYFDIKDYLKEYSKYRGNDLLLGVEMGMKEDCLEESRKLIKDSNLDYVIGSVHLIDNMDFYYDEYYKGKDKREAYEKYFNVMVSCLKNYNFIDSLGHIDYIARYSKYNDKEIYYSEFDDIIDEVLKTLIEKNTCLELSTRRLNDEKAVKNLMIIYKRFRELGGRYVTIGSDAHNPASIGNNFSKAIEIAKCCNLSPVYFKERRIQYDKI